MPNPALLFLDSDALIQILLVDAISILRRLKGSYGIQPVIVPEVEMEVGFSRKFGKQFQPALKRAFTNGTIQILDQSSFSAILSQNAELQNSAVGISYSDLQQRGADYNLRVDTGEAYTLAAACALKQPAVSNDMTAVRALVSALLDLPPSVMRAYDLLAFGYQSNTLTEGECEKCRKALAAQNEFIPKAQRNSSFVNGLKTFEPRLIDSSRATIGVVHPGTHFTSTLFVVPKGL